jgi:LysM repeat protein
MEGHMMKTESAVTGSISRKILLGLFLFASAQLVSGCVVLEEKYDAEKTRSLNFQKLLAQEERRTAELDSEIKRTKTELAAYEARSKELAGQLQTAREQIGRLQEEAETIKESAFLERKALDDMRKGGGQSASKKTAAPPEVRSNLSDLSGFTGMKAEAPKPTAVLEEPARASKTGATVHVVKPGETIFRISRLYGVEIEKLKKMNKLSDDIIEVGQKLIVGTE